MKDTSPALLPSVDAVIPRKVDAKIGALFSNRNVTYLAECLPADEFMEWRRQAFAIQRSIYGLDHYYEGTVVIERCGTQPLWSVVENNLLLSEAVDSVRVWNAFGDLQCYAEVEDRIHCFDSIDPREFARMVHFKCSDVRIARNLVWSFARTRVSRALMEFWDLYDECWELVEDVQDLFEDGRDWNFNFWLYSHMAGMSAVKGICGASHALQIKLSALEDSYRRLPTVDHDRYRSVFRRTIRCGRKVLDRWWIPLAHIAERSDIVLFSEKA